MHGHNPVLPPDVWIPDGEAHVMPDGRLYVYGSLDRHEDVYCSNEYRVVSTSDLCDWTVHDTSFAIDKEQWEAVPAATSPVATLGRWTKAKHLVKTGLQMRRSGVWPAFQRMMKAGRDAPRPALFAPDCIEKDGRYHLFFDLSDDSEGVAVSDRPEGPFRDPVRLPATGIDPAVFVDRDGSAYYYWGQFRASGVRLNDDMRGFDTRAVVHNLITEEEHHFHEGSSMRRIGDTYYLVFADTSRGRPTSLGYATAQSPLGPFTYRGVIIDNDGCDPQSWNNHGSIEQVDGRWYVFYHRSSGNSMARRRLCVEPITIAPDGSIAEVPMTSQGVGAPHAPGEAIEAWRACQVSGGAYVGPSAAGQEKLHLPGGGASGTFRYLVSDRDLTRATVDAHGAALLEIRLGAHATVHALTSGSRAFDLARPVGPGRYEVTITLRSGSDVQLRSLSLA
ncbi:family 43 glycosylhydrolase [Microbacterium sp. JZ101]